MALDLEESFDVDWLVGGLLGRLGVLEQLLGLRVDHDTSHLRRHAWMIWIYLGTVSTRAAASSHFIKIKNYLKGLN